MPSPFPGMDPYLENPVTWPDLHAGLITGIRRVLNPILRPKYVAHIEERVYISKEGDPGRRYLVPDVRVGETAEPIIVTSVLDEEFREIRLAITDVASREIVTVIEVISPTSKCLGSAGRVQYLEKRQEIMSSPTHLVEIDLLREGKTLFTQDPLPPLHYSVHVSRAEVRPDGKLWPILLSQRLPIIGIPLKPGDADAKLDLQAMLAAEYDAGSYDLVIDYDVAPAPPLAAEWPEWAANVIAKHSA